MSMGIMGIGAAFINAACAKAKKSENLIKFTTDVDDSLIPSITCSGKITIITTKNGSEISTDYTNLIQAGVSLQNDANTEIFIYGDVTELNASGLVSGDISVKSNSLLNLYISDCSSLSTVSIGECETITTLSLARAGNGFTNLDLRNKPNLKTLDVDDIVSVYGIYYDATNMSVSNSIATLITASIFPGAVYTDSDGAYYSTIADAATAKGWSIEQIPE